MIIFESEEFGCVRSLVTIGEPLFCLVDVCRVLDLDANLIARRIEKGVFSKHTLPTDEGPRDFTFINEDGICDVALESGKSDALKFCKWVACEAIPSLCETDGCFVSDDDFKYFQSLMPSYLSHQDIAQAISGMDGLIVLAKRQRKLLKELDELKTRNEMLFKRNQELAWEINHPVLAKKFSKKGGKS